VLLALPLSNQCDKLALAVAPGPLFVSALGPSYLPCILHLTLALCFIWNFSFTASENQINQINTLLAIKKFLLRNRFLEYVI
jgi:hypothetical protein